MIFSAATALYIGGTSYSKAFVGSTQVWPYETDYSREYLTFRITQSGNIKWRLYIEGEGTTADTRTISYSKDSGATWTQITSTTGGTTVSVNTGDVVMFKGTNSKYAQELDYYNNFSGTTCGFEAEGNIMSLIYDDNFIGQATLPSGNALSYMFQYCTGLTKANNLVLPATTLAGSSYNGMFKGCTSLTTAPELPATTLAGYCYEDMFKSCTSLISAPELPAKALTYNCYASMFSGCTSLTTAPELPATSVSIYCYNNMFRGCTSLTTAPTILPATALSTYCYYDMFRGCASLTTAPELPAAELKTSCYRNMFSGCTSLNYVKCLAQTGIGENNSTTTWLSGVGSTGTFVKKSGVNTWTYGYSSIPPGWTVQSE